MNVTPSSNERSDLVVTPKAERPMIANIDRVVSKAEILGLLNWSGSVPSRMTPVADILAFRDRMRQASVGREGPRPIVLHQISSEVGSYPGTMDDLRGQLAEQGVSLSETVDICGLEGHRFDRMIVVQTELGVLAGTAEGLNSLMASLGSSIHPGKS